EREEAPVREEIPVRLVLDLAHRGLAAPQMRGAVEETQRILRQVVFRVGDRQAGRLQEGEQERRDHGPGEPASTERRGPGAIEGVATVRASGAERVGG